MTERLAVVGTRPDRRLARPGRARRAATAWSRLRPGSRRRARPRLERGAVDAARGLARGGGRRRRARRRRGAGRGAARAGRAQVLEATAHGDDGHRTSARPRRGVVAAAGARRASSAATRSAARRRAAPRTPAPELFEGATWFLTPIADDRRRARTGSCTPSSPTLGALAGRDRPGAHDRLVALTSHLPHVLANVLVNQAGAGRVDGHDPLAAVGGSLRDMTRVAGANPRIWVDIFLDNREALRDGLREHSAPDRGARRGRSSARDAGFLARWIGRGRRQPPPAAGGGLSGRRPRSSTACSVHVPDRPGVFAGITQALGAERHQHRGLRAAPHLARARRHRRRCSSPGEDAGASARSSCSTRRATARSSRRLVDAMSAAPEPLLAGGRDRRRAGRARRQVDLAPRAADRRRSATARDARHRLRRLRRHARDARGGARARRRSRAGRTSDALRVHGVGLRGLRAPDGPIDVRQRGHAHAAPAGDAGRPERRVRRSTATSRIRRRPMDRSPTRWAQMGAVARDDATAARRCASTAGGGCTPIELRAAGRVAPR